MLLLGELLGYDSLRSFPRIFHSISNLHNEKDTVSPPDILFVLALAESTPIRMQLGDCRNPTVPTKGDEFSGENVDTSESVRNWPKSITLVRTRSLVRLTSC